MNFDDFYKVNRIDEPLKDILGATRMYLGVDTKNLNESSKQRNVLNEFRIKNKLSYGEIAKARGVSKQTVEESCKSKQIYITTIEKYAEALGFTVEEFMNIPEYKGRRILAEESQKAEHTIDLNILKCYDLSEIDFNKMKGKSFEEGIRILIEQLKESEAESNDITSGVITYKLSPEEVDKIFSQPSRNPTYFPTTSKRTSKIQNKKVKKA